MNDSTITAAAFFSSVTNTLGVIVILMFLTGNCNAFNTRNRDYLGESIETVRSFNGEGDGLVVAAE